MLISLCYCRIIVIRNRHIFVRPVIKSVKNVRCFANLPHNNILPDKRTSQISSDETSWIKDQYQKAIGIVEELSGVKEIRASQDEVIKIQDKLWDTQEERRLLLQNLLELRRNIQTLNNDIHAMEKGNPHYLELVKRQIELMQKEREADNYFQVVDASERNLFTHLTSAVKTSHEKERKQSENSKYFSMMLSMCTAVLGIVGSTVVYHLRNKNQKTLIDRSDRIEQEIVELKSKVGVITDLESAVLEAIEHLKPKDVKRESWSEYFYRHGSTVYRWFVPKR
ncbi:mitochondrial potassium channel-like [Phlebotomus argentipes]|uniref:mitochondrial potassium channel-like n=1 Tax=Phlebotomus argentipes TaxID=94469 RepID=UPI0028932944|nr:mitochondrial potassium channel-like [Phlebotomus argentipes]